MLLVVSLLSSCRYTKRLEKGQYLVEKNKIIVEGEKIPPAELEAVIKTQPNRKIFGKPRFHLWLYNLPGPNYTKRKSENKLARYTNRVEKKKRKAKKKNDKRKAKGKPEIPFEPKPLKRSFPEWLKASVGEPPVLLDSSKVKSSVKNLGNYLFKKGYFNSRVRDSIALDSIHKKAYLFYFVETHSPYYIDTFIVSGEDKKILKQIKSANAECLIKIGNRLDIDVLDEERSRLTVFLKDRGYYDISKDFFSYSVDSFKLDSAKHAMRRVILTMRIGRIQKKKPDSDSTWFEDHQRYIVNNIYIYTDYGISEEFSLYDTTMYHEHLFLFKGKPSMRPQNLLQHIFINKGYYYRAKEVEATYKKLASLGLYKSINISFKQNIIDPSTPTLDCYIKLKPLKRQNFVFEANGTNRGGNLGISGNYSYKNKNLFRGAEAFKFSLNGGLEAQQLLSNQNDATVGQNVGIGEFKPLNTFNTIEFGPEVSLSIPKFLTPFNLVKFNKTSSPKTIFNAALNFQQRPDFTRGIQEASLGYEWHQNNKDKLINTENRPISSITHYLSPLKLSAVKINPSPEFSERLNTIKDPFLKYSYTDHIILGFQYQFNYALQRNNPNKDQLFIKAGFEQSGNLMREIFNLAKAEQDSIGSYEILGIRFAHFIKADVDFRYYINFNKSSQLVYRTAAGIGVPLANLSEALPFEKSFYVGGSNGLRAFRARTIGPGGFYDTTITFDKIGDILIEGNIEYRFDLLKIVKGALFYDVGNVWLIKPNPGKEQGEFSSKFYKQLAMGAGVGLRFDFDFFIFRFDFAYPIRQPSLPDGEKWFFQPKTITNSWIKGFAERNELTFAPFKSKLIVNIGIGYPF